MDLALEPNLYCPSIDSMGQYIDKIPSHPEGGIRCPCGSRKDKTYNNYSAFYTHCKSLHHQKWLAHLNDNRANYYIENEKLKGIVENQKLIIAQMDRDLRNKNMTIDYLTQQLVSQQKTSATANLLDMD